VVELHSTTRKRRSNDPFSLSPEDEYHIIEEVENEVNPKAADLGVLSYLYHRDHLVIEKTVRLLKKRLQSQ
jgi:hypothetical protein